jgi:aspartate aminotransferase-like enzyme
MAGHEQEWVLLNPGPGNTTRAVREALVTPDLCHREAEFFAVMRECREALARLRGEAMHSPLTASRDPGPRPWRRLSAR